MTLKRNNEVVKEALVMPRQNRQGTKEYIRDNVRGTPGLCEEPITKRPEIKGTYPTEPFSEAHPETTDERLYRISYAYKHQLST